jgi:hypothetical protein
MGGIGTALRSNATIHFSNPASYSSLDTNSFIFDFGIDYGRNILSDGASSFTSEDMNFDHLLIGFPLAKGWGFAAGIVPVSSGYYNLSETVLKIDPGYDPIVGEYISNHTGEGGFTNFFLGSGININKNFSAGINMTMLFGQVKRNYLVSFNDIFVYQNNTSEKLELSGVNFDYGIQYTAALKNNYFINAGVSLNSGKYFTSKYQHLSYKSTTNGVTDTISDISDNSTSAFIPGTLRLGLSLGKKNKFTTGFDFVSTKWTKSRIPGAEGYSGDTRTFLFGAEFTPDRFSNFSFLKRMDYRIGGHVGDNYLVINGEQLKEYGASIGFGVPLRRSLSTTNFYFDITRKTGAAGSSLHTENYFTFGISLNLYDFWFIKRKYD